MGASPDIITFGCRLNAYESEVIRDHVTAAGLADTVIVNTCAVTAEAERQARQAIRKIRRERPDARIIVTGCAAQISPETYAAMPEIDHVLGNREKLEAGSWAALGGHNHAPAARVSVGDIMTVRETAHHLVSGFEGRSRAFLEVQQGCDHRCTFCIIPFGRGNNRSVPLGEVARRAEGLVAAGFGEIVLTGVDLASYGADLPGRPALAQAVRRLLAAVPGIKRLRLSSLDPAAIDDDLISLFATEERLLPHVHLSLQAGDDLILKRMKRRHDRAMAIALVERLRSIRPDMVFGADLIAGFPTEDATMFARSLDIIDECHLTWLHVFPFSARSGTPAARMPQVPQPLRKERAAMLRAKGEARAAAYLATRMGSIADVLIEQGSEGHDQFFAPVELLSPVVTGSVVKAEIVEARSDRLIARIAA